MSRSNNSFRWREGAAFKKVGSSLKMWIFKAVYVSNFIFPFISIVTHMCTKLVFETCMPDMTLTIKCMWCGSYDIVSFAWTDAEACSKESCKNGGLCSPRCGGGIECKCPASYYGEKCEFCGGGNS